MQRSIRTTALALLLGFVIVALTLGYWQVWRAQDLGTSPQNPRVAQAERDAPRGRILDRNGVVLAQSVPGPNGSTRSYSDPDLALTVGVHSARFGNTGIEAAYDSVLRGQRSPDFLSQVGAELFHTQPAPGDVELTIDRRIQDVATQTLLDNHTAGAVVALDPRTGAVLAMASTPFVDPNGGDAVLAAAQSAAQSPLLNRATSAALVPGSTFKAVTASAAVDLGLVDLNQKFHCSTAIHIGTYSVNCNNNLAFPYLTYKEAFAWSSNRTFALSGVLLGFPGPMNPWLDDHPPGPYPWEQSGASIVPSAQRLEEYAQRYGFGRQIPFDLPVRPSQVKDPATPWTLELLAQTAFGQGQIEATPLQMALVAAGIANQGRVPVPYLVQEVRSGGSVSHPDLPGRVFSQAVSAQTAQTLVGFFLQGTISGYAQPAAIPGVQVGGKTGSAEVGDGTEHSWFIGFAPANDPLVAVAVVMEHKGPGDKYATPAGRQVMQEALKDYKR